MKIRSLFLLALPLCGSVCSAQPPTETTPDRVSIRPEMLLNEAARGNAFELFDEPDSKAPQTTWSDGYNGLSFPMAAWVDLGAEFQIREIALYDSNGTGNFGVQSGLPFEWEPLFSDSLTNYQQWNRHEVNVRTRFLRFVLPDPETRVPEVRIFGTIAEPVAPVVAAPVAEPRKLPTMDALIGTNAFVDDPLDKMGAVGWVREYHNFAWDAGDGAANAPAFPNNRVAFNPSFAGGGWNFDDYYRRLKLAGITVCPAIQGSVSWLNPNTNFKPIEPGADAMNPNSYRAHADQMFQFAARYGSRKVDDAKLKLAPDQERLSGLNLLRFFENANEPDATWHGRGGYSTPFELAARCSADYDGDQGKMGDTFGVKSADPNAQMVLGGLAGLNINYIRAMKAWADWNRGGSFPADAINVHHYSNNSGRAQGEGEGQVGVSPEADRLQERLSELVAYRNRELPGKELWFSEFGYDTHPTSVQRAPAIGTTSQSETQARWIVRSYLLSAAAGVDRAAQYMLRDVNPNDATKFSTSGLVTQKGEWKPKTAWFYTSTLKTRLAGMRFQREISSKKPKVRVLQFGSDLGKTAFVAWCPTSDNTRVPNFSLPVGTARKATLVTLTDGETNGVASLPTIKNGAVTLEASEKPAIVLGF